MSTTSIPTPGRIRGILKRKGIKKLPDQDGNEFPVDMIRDDLIRKHYVAYKIEEEALKVHSLLCEFKEMTLDMTDELYAIRKERDDISKRSKGGQTLYTLDKSAKIEIKSGSRTIYDTELAEAGEAAFDRFIAKKKEGGTDDDVIQIMQASLQKRDGDYDPRKLANLYKLKIQDPDFQEGLRLFAEARDTNRTKSYIKVERKTGREDEYESVVLDVARI